MNKEIILLLLSWVYFSVGVTASENPVYWRIDSKKAIIWDVYNETRLPRVHVIALTLTLF